MYDSFLLMHLIWQRSQGREIMLLVAVAIPWIKLLIPSLHYRIREWLSLGFSEDHLVQSSLLKVESTRSSCLGWNPAGFEQLQGWSLQKKGFFLCLNRISYVSVCVRCLLSCHWTPLKSVRISPPYTHQIYTEKTALSLLFFHRTSSITHMFPSFLFAINIPILLPFSFRWASISCLNLRPDIIFRGKNVENTLVYLWMCICLCVSVCIYMCLYILSVNSIDHSNRLERNAVLFSVCHRIQGPERKETRSMYR